LDLRKKNLSKELGIYEEREERRVGLRKRGASAYLKKLFHEIDS